jgi:hypothetical protein
MERFVLWLDCVSGRLASQRVRGELGVWQRKQHRHWRGSSTWYHVRLARGIAVNVWKTQGIDHHVIEFGSASEVGPAAEDAARRAALKMARALCLEAAARAARLLSGRPRRHSGAK